MKRDPAVAVVCAGMSGLCLAIRLLTNGIENVATLYEKASDVGGTWRDNTYPGLVCDVPSRLYQYSFAKNPQWSSLFSSGREIHSYFREVTDYYRLRERIRFGTEIAGARFDNGSWWVRTTAGEESKFVFLIAATGLLHHPHLPDIDGLEHFAGSAFHSARWNHQVVLKDRRIAVIGTGSTGVQLVSALAGVAAKLTMFQRTSLVDSALAKPHIFEADSCDLPRCSVA